MTIDQFIQELRTMDTYHVDIDSTGEHYCERHPDGEWVDAYSLECLIDEFENSRKTSS
jgi:hypothetical protein